ncbi:P-type DNA transfer ATPase VirB11 [Delftia sp. GW456-R20]|uniref:P-type DNA transfer ATPase VirB11 n=1 Tax=Delftia sp. GW456-R20 TaxID=1827145 RepID=UPI0018D39824|nr:P-type DNA transfer ATPase VirB11 [Delftia sp. GW456-R20]
MEDKEVTEIAVNKPGIVHYEKNGVWNSEIIPAVTFQHLIALGTAVGTFSAQKWDPTLPLLSAPLPGGERIQLIRPPSVEEGTVSLTLRLPSAVTRSLNDFEAAGLFSSVKPASKEVSPTEELLLDLLNQRKYSEFMKEAVLNRMNIVVAGETGSGKTTFMKALIKEIPHNERLISIEDVRELFVDQPNTVHLLYSKGGQSSAQVTSKQLFEACMRAKPNRILVAEVRGDECFEFIEACQSGQAGSITSVHAGSPAEAFERMTGLIKKSPNGQTFDYTTIKRLLHLTIDVIVQFQNPPNGNRHISEIYFDPKEKRRLKNEY